MANNTWLKITVWIVSLALFASIIIGMGFGIKAQGLEEVNNFLLKYVFYGEKLTIAAPTLTTQPTTITAISLLIIVLMIWLIVFVAFGDILENFSAFSGGIAWVISFAFAVIAANAGIYDYIFSYVIEGYAVFGIVAVFAALAASFIIFILVNWGATPLKEWIAERQEMVDAARGRTSAASGLRTLKKIGKVTAEGEGS